LGNKRYFNFITLVYEIQNFIVFRFFLFSNIYILKTLINYVLTMSRQDPLVLGPVGGRTQNSFGSGCITGPNKFGDPKALGPDPILLGHVLGSKVNGSSVRTQLDWVRHHDPILLGSYVRTQD
jgi:hypothetical protein